MLTMQMDVGIGCPRRLLRSMEGWPLVCDCVLWHVPSKKSDGVRMQDFSVRTFSTRLYGKLWEHVMKTALKK